AAAHGAAASAVGKRAVVTVLDEVERVEQRRALRRVDLVLAQRALAGLRVDPPDLERDRHHAPPTVDVASTTVDGAGGATSTVAPKSDSFMVSSTWARIAWFVYAFVV